VALLSGVSVFELISHVGVTGVAVFRTSTRQSTEFESWGSKAPYQFRAFAGLLRPRSRYAVAGRVVLAFTSTTLYWYTNAENGEWRRQLGTTSVPIANVLQINLDAGVFRAEIFWPTPDTGATFWQRRFAKLRILKPSPRTELARQVREIQFHPHKL